MVEEFKGEVAPKIITSVFTSNTQDGNLTNYGANILNSGPRGRQFSEYTKGLNEVLDMTDSVNSNADSISSDDFLSLMNINGPKKYMNWNCLQHA